MNRTRWILIGVLAVLLAIFVVQNTEVVEVRFLFWSLSMSRIVLLPLTFLAGLAAGWLLARIRARAQAREQASD